MNYKDEYLEIKLNSRTLSSEAWDLKVLIKNICSKKDFDEVDADTVETLSKYMRIIHGILKEKGTKILSHSTDIETYFKQAYLDLLQETNQNQSKAEDK